MRHEITQWNRRARYLLLVLDTKAPDSPVAKAGARLQRWRELQAQLGPAARELRAVAHPPGLARGPVGDAVSSHESGCLVLSSPVGDGKTSGAAWRAYHARGAVLWLDAARVGQCRQEQQHTTWLAQCRTADLVVLDDLGAPGSFGLYETPRVVSILTALAARPERSIVTTNQTREVFLRIYDGIAKPRPGEPAQAEGRLTDRLRARPNRWVDIPPGEESRRAQAEPPPDGLPPREQRAQEYVRAVGALTDTAQAYVMADVDHAAVLLVARGLGMLDAVALDARVAEHEAGRARIDELIQGIGSDMDAANRWAEVVKPAADKPPEEEPGAAQRRRVALLDLLDYTANQLGRDPAEVLAELGRTRRTLAPEDEPRLLALAPAVC